MRVLVTGGSGKIGRAAIQALRAAGHTAIIWDLAPTAPGALKVDCTDFGQVFGTMSGADPFGRAPEAVVHLAGIPAPGLAPDHVIFHANTASTYNVLSAASRLGIRRVVWASSETMLGLPFATPPDFAPVDETHPDRPEWSYALSKAAGELMAEAIARWTPGLSIASLRFSNVYEPHDYAQVPQIQARPETRRFNLWSYVDARDAGEACRLAVEADFAGHETMIIAAADTLLDRPSEEMMAESFPSTPLRDGLSGTSALLSSEKARRLIGYQARHSWRDPA
jgi:nucleoside-diphosphate-sugar epimerase